VVVPSFNAFTTPLDTEATFFEDVAQVNDDLAEDGDRIGVKVSVDPKLIVTIPVRFNETPVGL